MEDPTIRRAGGLVISLDFELHWGMRDHLTVEQYRSHLLGVRQAVPALLELFQKYEIHATWATVGMLFCENKRELLEFSPALRPDYRLSKLSPYLDLDSVGEDEASDPFHYAPSLIRMIASAPHQEIGTHTFSHFYCLEDGSTTEAFEADLESARRVAKRFNIALKSLVFPRNQYSDQHLQTCKRVGITSVRGNPSGWIYAPSRTADESLVQRGLRLADAYVDITGHNGHHCDLSRRPVNVPASRFLRPYSPKLKSLDALRMKRILHDLEDAAESERIYHLWWHPHNFGAWLPENLAFLEAILRHCATLRDKKGFHSWSMMEAAQTEA